MKGAADVAPFVVFDAAMSSMPIAWERMRPSL
jgi:hypothetical protein